MKFFKKTDVLIILILIAISIIGILIYNLFFSKINGIANIYYDSKLVKTIDLSLNKDYSFYLDQNPNVLIHVTDDGYIYFEKSNCPNKICIKSGKIKKVGKSIACLPNKIVIKIVSSKEDLNAPDLILGG